MRESNNNSNKQKNIYLYHKSYFAKTQRSRKKMQNIISSRKKNTSKHNTR